MYSPNYRQAGTPVINIQLPLRIFPDMCKKLVLFGSKGKWYTIYTEPLTCIPKEGAKKMYIHFKKGKFDCPACRMVTLTLI